MPFSVLFSFSYDINKKNFPFLSRKRMQIENLPWDYAILIIRRDFCENGVRKNEKDSFA